MEVGCEILHFGMHCGNHYRSHWRACAWRNARVRGSGVFDFGCSTWSVAAMSAFGPKRTSLAAPHMSAFGGKADMAFCGGPLLRSLLGVKRTWLVAPHMSAFDPKRTSVRRSMACFLTPTGAFPRATLNR